MENKMIYDVIEELEEIAQEMMDDNDYPEAEELDFN
jgi:hypothetical protein